mmetsp:Transcript_27847/g.88516  ORF Transcript_27847/g.88516 Transcript_27847/m.88516 type:complete len:130 (-) Transcript_27847:74-463(-)
MAPRVVLFALLAAAALSGSQAAAPWSQVSSPAAWTPPAEQLRGGFNPFAGINPFGYKITDLGEKFLAFDGSKESDLGRLLSSLKSRKTTSQIKAEWIELVRFSKTAQAAHILRTLQELLDFLLATKMID